MINWTFNANDYDPAKPRGFELIDEGDHRCRIEETKEDTSKKSGKQMIVLTLAIAGYKTTVKSYTVLDPDNAERTNQNLGYIFDSFGLTMGNMDIESWVGSVGGVHIKHEEYEKNNKSKGIRAVVDYFLSPAEIGKLPAWPDSKAATASAPVSSAMPAVSTIPSDGLYDDDGDVLFTDEEAKVADKLPF